MASKSKLVTRKERLRGAGVAALASVGPDDNLSRSEATLDEALALCESKIKSLATLAPELVDSNEIYKISCAASSLAKTKIESRRWDCERGGLLLIAESRIEAKIRELVGQQPELCQALLDISREARRELESAPLVISES